MERAPSGDRPGRDGQPLADARASASGLILHLHPTRVPAKALRFSYTWGLGGISPAGLMLAVTGVLLMFRYEPTSNSAYLSIQALETEVIFGSLVRALHHWSANLLVDHRLPAPAARLFHRRLQAGAVAQLVDRAWLLLFVLAFNFTGYLLPWDQLAYWAITVSTTLIAYIPLVGPDAQQRWSWPAPRWARARCSNFYALHVAVLPRPAVITGLSLLACPQGRRASPSPPRSGAAGSSE